MSDLGIFDYSKISRMAGVSKDAFPDAPKLSRLPKLTSESGRLDENEHPVHTWADGEKYQRESPGVWVRLSDKSTNHGNHNYLENHHAREGAERVSSMKPWDLTREEFETNPPKGYVVQNLRKYGSDIVAMALPNGKIAVDPENFFGHSQNDRKDIIAHEKAHFIEEMIKPQDKAKYFDNKQVMAYRGKNINEKLANMIQDKKLHPDIIRDYPGLGEHSALGDGEEAPELKHPHEIIGENPKTSVAARGWNEQQFFLNRHKPGEVVPLNHRGKDRLWGNSKGGADKVHHEYGISENVGGRGHLLMARTMKDDGSVRMDWSPVGEHDGGNMGIAEAYRGDGAGVAMVKHLMKIGKIKPSIGYSPEGLKAYQKAHKQLVEEAMDAKKPVHSAALAYHGIKAPEGYEEEGGRHVYRHKTAPLSGEDTTAKKKPHVFEIKNVKISDLPERATAIGMSQDKFNSMSEDIKQNGMKNPIVIDENTGQVLDGQHRAFVASRLGMKEIPAIHVDGRKYSLKRIQEISEGHRVEPKDRTEGKNPHVTETPEFKKWFGDSKVVDGKGKPLVVYHGTDKEIKRFNPKLSAQGVFWFTSDSDKIKRGESGASSSKVIMPVYLSAKKLAGWDEYEKKGLWELKNEGYDGVKLDDDYIVFEPTQIKSATKNKGTFDSTNPKITHSLDFGMSDLLKRATGVNTVQNISKI